MKTMINLKRFKQIMTLLLLLIVSAGVFAQSKFKETFNVGDDVVVSLNTSYTHIIFETWNKNKVEVEAFIDADDLTEAEKQKLFDDWNFDVLGNSKRVIITSNAANNRNDLRLLSNAQLIPDMEFMEPLMTELLGPMMNNLQDIRLPENVLSGLGNIQFDYKEFKKDEKGYMKKFEAEMEKNFGKDFEMKMKVWGDEFGKHFEENYGPEFEKRMEEWGDKFGKNFEEKMEAWGENFGRKLENYLEEDNENFPKQINTSPNGNNTIIIQSNRRSNTNESKAKKTLIIRMPKNAKTEINVRHGEIKMADATNVKATLNYSPFTANSIDGGQTLINAAYAPVAVNNWNYGTLVLKFVDECKISKAESINLNANSSDVLIENIGKEALLSGSFGALKIDNISNTFSTIEIELENTDAIIHIPNTAFSFSFNAKKSSLKSPKSLVLTREKNYDRVLVKGLNNGGDTDKLFTINSKYSNVTLH